MPIRQMLPRLLLSLFLGALSTLAIALALGGLVPWDTPTIRGTYLSPHGTTQASVHVWQATQPGAIRRAVGTYATVLWNGAADELPVVISTSAIARDSDIDTSWGRLREALTPSATQVAAVEEARGWPMLALWCWRDPSLTSPPTTGGGYFFEPGPFDPPPWRVLPWLPIWRGIVVDTGLYSAAWACVLIGPGAIRTRLRLRGVRCPTCGYDLSASGGIAGGCPECGWNRAPRE